MEETLNVICLSIKDQIYLNNLLLDHAKWFAFDDILMIITEIDYYETLKR